MFEYYPEKTGEKDIYAIGRTNHASDFINDPEYTGISEDRLSYLKRVIALCEEHNTRVIVFVTPLYARLLNDVYEDENLNARLAQFKHDISEITSYYDFLTINPVTEDARYFGDPSHVKPTTGNLILARLFGEASVELPQGFGVYVEKAEPHRGVPVGNGGG